MDGPAGIASGVVAAVLIVTFTGICVWAYSAARRHTFDAISRLPLEDDPVPGGPLTVAEGHSE